MLLFLVDSYQCQVICVFVFLLRLLLLLDLNVLCAGALSYSPSSVAISTPFALTVSTVDDNIHTVVFSFSLMGSPTYVGR